MRLHWSLLIFPLFFGCDEPGAPESPAEPVPEVVASPEPAPEPEEVGPLSAEFVADRVAAARQRLSATEPGRLVLAAIDAHGGLEAWLRAGTLRFEFDYAPVGRPERRMHTENTIDIWSARAMQREIGEGADAQLGWDGERAWITPNAEAFPSTARFWATTPYYFVGLPFVLGDPGVALEQLPDAPLDGDTHQIVKVTYEDGTGDSPDDYYVLYIHPESKRMNAIRYVVAYPGFFPDGGHSPEKLMRYTGWHEVSGLQLPSELDTYAWNAEDETVGDKVTEIAVGAVRLGQTVPLSTFAPPAGAEVSTEIEPRH